MGNFSNALYCVFRAEKIKLNDIENVAAHESEKHLESLACQENTCTTASKL